MKNKPRKEFFRLRLEADHERILDARVNSESDLEDLWKDARHKIGRR